MKKVICVFLTLICLLNLAACEKGDAPYTPIPENFEDYEIGGANYDGVIITETFEGYANNSELAVECEYVGPYEYMRLETRFEQPDGTEVTGQKNFTYQKFKVISVLRGEFSESEIIVRTDGGTVYTEDKKRIIEEYNWTPDFKAGDKWIFFLNKGSRLDKFCIDGDYYIRESEIMCFDEKLDKYRTLRNMDTLQLTPDAKGEVASKYCFTAQELKAVLDEIAAPLPPQDLQERIDYRLELAKKELERGEITQSIYDDIVQQTKPYDYARILVRHKAE